MIVRRLCTRIVLQLTIAIAVVVLSFSILLILIGKEMHDSQRDAKRMKCAGHMSVIASAMDDYHAKYGHYPPAILLNKDGMPAHSWRVLLLEFIDDDLFQMIDLESPWNSEKNRRHESRMPWVYRCPLDTDERLPFHTSYFVVTGEFTLFPESRVVSKAIVGKPLSEVVLLVESISNPVHWMEPKDIPYSDLSRDPKAVLKSSHSDNPYFCTADQQKQNFYGFTEEEILMRMRIR